MSYHTEDTLKSSTAFKFSLYADCQSELYFFVYEFNGFKNWFAMILDEIKTNFTCQGQSPCTTGSKQTLKINIKIYVIFYQIDIASYFL